MKCRPKVAGPGGTPASPQLAAPGESAQEAEDTCPRGDRVTFHDLGFEVI